MDKFANKFHGVIEPLRDMKISLPNIVIELIELSVMVTVVYIIFFLFKDSKKSHSPDGE